MQLREVVRRRRMVRSYDPDRPVPARTLTRVLDQATRAPSAGFSQGWDFLVLDTPADRDLFWRTATPPADADRPDGWLRGMRTAPALVVCLSNVDAYLDRYAQPDKGFGDRDEQRWAMPYWHVDTGMAALLILLTAVDEGLGACFFGIPREQHPGVLAAFGVPGRRAPVGVVALGWQAPDRLPARPRRGRRPLADVAHHGRFGRPWSPT